jgi:WD40 repeat protein
MIKHFFHLLLSCFLPAFLSAQILELIAQQEGHSSEVKLVCFSPDDRQALSADAERLILWDLNSGKFVRGIPIVASPRLISFSASGQEVLALLEDASLNSWDLNTGRLLWKVILPVNKYFKTETNADGSTRVSDIESMEVYSVMISPDRRCMVAAYNKDKLACCDL